MSSKLKTCPFCGGKAEVYESLDEGFYRVVCSKCYTLSDYYSDKDKAIKAWNTRNYPEKQDSSNIAISEQSCKEENSTCKKSLQLTRSDIELLVKPLQWEDFEKRTTYENGFSEVYRSGESNLFFGVLKFRIFKFHNEFKELRLLDCSKGQSISIKSGNYSLEEAQQHARNWLVNLVCSALGVEE